MAAKSAAVSAGSRPSAAAGGGAIAPALNRRSTWLTLQPSLRPLTFKTVAPFRSASRWTGCAGDERHCGVRPKNYVGPAPRLLVDKLPAVSGSRGVLGPGRSTKCSPVRVSKSRVPLNVMTNWRAGASCHSKAPPALVSRNEMLMTSTVPLRMSPRSPRGRSITPLQSAGPKSNTTYH